MGRTRFLIVILLLLGGLLPAHAQAEVVRVMLQSPALADNALGLPNQRELTIYLPPGYARSDHRRYPVLYLLHGFTSAPIEWFDGSYQGLDLATVLDAQAAAGKVEYIVVIPEADNPMGGSFYVNSRAFGRWDDFISHDVVAFIDSHYRTRADRLHRGIAGQSMGGFGALSLAGRHPDLFAHVYALSPYGLDMSGELSEDNPVWRAMNKPASEWPANVPPGLVKIVKVEAAAFAPAGEVNLGPVQALPYRVLRTGLPAVNARVMTAWHAQLPLYRLQANPAPYRQLADIVIEYGTLDAIANVRLGSAAFIDALHVAGIPVVVRTFNGGHVDHARDSFEQRLLPYFADLFGEPTARAPQDQAEAAGIPTRPPVAPAPLPHAR